MKASRFSFNIIVKLIGSLTALTGLVVLFQNCSQTGKLAQYESTAQGVGAVLAADPTVILSPMSDLISTSSVTISFVAANASSITCQLNNMAVQDCSSQSITYNNLNDGDYTFNVVATSANGKSATVAKVFRKDSTAPVISVSSQPASMTNMTTASFAFMATDNLSGVQSVMCSLDNASFQSCSSPSNLSNLVAGTHNFRIQAADKAGNMSSIYTYSWSINLTAPTVNLTSNPSSVTNQTSASFAFSGQNIVSYQCQIDGGAYAACTSPKAYSGLGAGSHTFRVMGTDGNGQSSAAVSYMWNVDNVAPNAPSISANVQSVTNATAASFSFSAVDAGSGIAGYQCSLYGASYANCTSPKAYSALASGNHTFKVKASDNAGNTSSESSFSWSIDLVGPSLAFTQTPSSSTSTSAAFAFTASDSGAGLNSIQCSLDNAAFANCTSPVNLSGLSVAAHNFRVQASDKVGNSSMISHDWTISSASSGGGSGGGGSTVPSGGTESSQTLSMLHPTINNISVEWAPEQMTQDTAQLYYRPQNTSTWYEAMPMRLVKAGGTNDGAAPSNNCKTYQFCWSGRYSGSIFNVQANTTYEIMAQILDSSGKVVYYKNGTVKTRAVPVAMANAPVTNVSSSSQLTTALKNASPGDIIQLAAGTYSGFTMSKSGTEGKPIVIRGGPGVTINGSVYLTGISWVHLENTSVNNGTIRIDNSHFLAITGNTVNSGQARGIGSNGGGATESDLYIADNTVIGGAAWAANNLAVSGGIQFEGIELSGPGHVIMNNKVSGYRDCISFYEADEAVNQYSLDVLNNDLSMCVDDAIEADSCYNNCRVMRNRVTNTFMGLSSQPSLGGHNYFIKNVLYSVFDEPLKLHNDTRGDVVLNNTIVKNGDAFGIYDDSVKIGDAYIRNNLMIGSSACSSVKNSAGDTFKNCSGSSGKVMSLPTFDTSSSTIDYQAYGVINSSAFTGTLGNLSFSSFAKMGTSLSSNETHSMQADLSVFQNTISLPSTSVSVEAPQNFQIKSNAPIVGKGLRIPNINDGVAQPAIGAFEAGEAMPVYGPRQ